MAMLSRRGGRYPSLTAFYAANPVRRDSSEVDVGLWWREGEENPVVRAAWLRETGELIAVRYGAVEDGGGTVEVLAVVPSHDALAATLSGWEDVCGEPDSLRWLRDRAAATTPA
jgi:hypothetical protein